MLIPAIVRRPLDAPSAATSERRSGVGRCARSGANIYLPAAFSCAKCDNLAAESTVTSVSRWTA